MKFLGVLLAIFAVSCVRANPEECTEETGEACIDNLLTAILNDRITEEDLCRELLSSVDCLKELLNVCLGERNSAVDDSFEELDKLLSNCKAYAQGDNDNDEEMGELEKCYQQDQGDIIWCIDVGTDKLWDLPHEKDYVDKNIMDCARYGMMAGCFVDTFREKCGEKAATMVKEELSELPDAFAEACNGVGDIDSIITLSRDLIGEEKRK